MDSLEEKNAPSIITTGLVVVSVIFPLLAFLAMALRFQARRVTAQPLKADDWWAVASLIFSLGESIVVWVFSALIGIDSYKGSLAEGAEGSRLSLWISVLLLQIAISTVKLSVLCLYQRIFHRVRIFNIALSVMMVLVVCWCLVFFLLIIFELEPVSASWKGGGTPTFDTTAMTLAQVSTSFILDFLVLTMPLPLVAKLHLPLKKKIQISLIFLLGTFCCVAAIVRLALEDQVIRQVVLPTSKAFETIYIESKVYIFFILESNCSIIAVCLPCYGPLLKGRDLGSIVRSIRSTISLRSSIDKSTSSSSKWPKGSSENEEHHENMQEASWPPQGQMHKPTRTTNLSSTEVEDGTILVTQSFDVSRS